MPCEEFKDNASHRSLWENKKELHVLYKTLWSETFFTVKITRSAAICFLCVLYQCQHVFIHIWWLFRSWYIQCTLQFDPSLFPPTFITCLIVVSCCVHYTEQYTSLSSDNRPLISSSSEEYNPLSAEDRKSHTPPDDYNALSSGNRRVESQPDDYNALNSDNRRVESQPDDYNALNSDNRRVESQPDDYNALNSDNRRVESQPDDYNALNSDNRRVESQLDDYNALNSDNRRVESQPDDYNALNSDNRRVESQPDDYNALASDKRRVDSQPDAYNALTAERARPKPAPRSQKVSDQIFSQPKSYEYISTPARQHATGKGSVNTYYSEVTCYA